MKEITDRKELAEAVNIKRLPVIRFNWEKPIYPEWPDSHDGENALIPFTFRDGTKTFWPVRTAYYDDTEEFVVTQKNACLSDSFCYEDANQMIEEQRAPILTALGECVIVKQWPSKREARFFIARVTDINRFASDCARIV